MNLEFRRDTIGTAETLPAINFTCHLIQQKVACCMYFKLMIFGENKIIEVQSPTVNLEWRRHSIGTAETLRCSYSLKTTSAVILKAKWRPKFVRSWQIEQDLRLSIYAPYSLWYAHLEQSKMSWDVLVKVYFEVDVNLSYNWTV